MAFSRGERLLPAFFSQAFSKLKLQLFFRILPQLFSSVPVTIQGVLDGGYWQQAWGLSPAENIYADSKNLPL